MVTSKLSRTLKKAISWNPARQEGVHVSGGRGSPDELGFRVDVPHPVLGQGLVHTVEECPQKTPQHSHQDEEGQVHSGPQVAALVSVWTLSEQTSHTSSDQFSSPPQEARVGRQKRLKVEGQGGGWGASP